MTAEEKKAYRAVLKRSNGVSELSGGLPIVMHHIILRSHQGATVKENLIALTPKEHRMVHNDEKYWTEELLNRMRGIYGIIEEKDLHKKGKYSNFAIPN